MSPFRVFQTVFFGLFLSSYAVLAMVALSRALRDLVTGVLRNGVVAEPDGSRARTLIACDRVSSCRNTITVEKKNSKTLVLVCHQNFCRLLDRVLRGEGLTDFQHGDLSLVGGSVSGPQVGSATEVFVVPTDNERAQRLIRLLRACPVRGETEETFELYTVGD